MNKLVLFAVLFCSSAFAMLNPATVYCEAMGYEHRVETTEYGERGVCVVEGNSVEEWEFLLGKQAQNYSYCAKNGYGIEMVGGAQCEKFLLDSCMACVLPDGRKVEVTELMGLDFRETTCGDSFCNLPETYASCPQDCPSGSNDEYCDGVKDGRCDPDCKSGEDQDCAAFQPSLIILIGMALSAILGAVIWKIFLAKKRTD